MISVCPSRQPCNLYEKRRKDSPPPQTIPDCGSEDSCSTLIAGRHAKAALPLSVPTSGLKMQTQDIPKKCEGSEKFPVALVNVVSDDSCHGSDSERDSERDSEIEPEEPPVKRHRSVHFKEWAPTKSAIVETSEAAASEEAWGPQLSAGMGASPLDCLAFLATRDHPVVGTVATKARPADSSGSKLLGRLEKHGVRLGRLHKCLAATAAMGKNLTEALATLKQQTDDDTQ
mmetsp:Transcript_24356/g.54923  ORF Transcript_24356/g.54923 Transcript_24356/m.54923 type:complete len:230 (-) Transcript_24356:347-1036(-)